MKKLSEFTLSLLALPFLIPLYLSEKLFEFVVQPALLRKFHLGVDSRRTRIARALLVLLAILVVIAVVDTIVTFFRSQSSFGTALMHGHILLFMLYNKGATFINTLLTPLNTLLAFTAGSYVSALRLMIALYLLFLPALFLVDIGYRLVRDSSSLRRAIRLRNEAVREVDIVRFSEQARGEEIFLGLDLSRNSKPFYAQRSWLQGHLQVIGSPGSGKTESIIQPLWFQHVRRNLPTIVVDGRASRQNIDKLYTIASSLAQGHEILYFNPADPERSATYNPLRRGTVAEIKNRILGSLPGTALSASTRERLDYYLNLVLQSIGQTKEALSLNELSQYFNSKVHLQKQLGKVAETSLQAGLSEILKNYTAFQNETAYLGALLRELCQSEYGWLFDSDEPEIDLRDVHTGRKDCYFTLPMSAGDVGMHFLGQLIVGDVLSTFRGLGLQRNGDSDRRGGLLVFDEAAPFLSPQFLELLRVSRDLEVIVCYTHQSLAELSHADPHLGSAFGEQLANHTNVVCSFHLGSPESIDAVLRRMGMEQKKEEPAAAAKGGQPGSGAEDARMADPNFLRHLEVGRCLTYVRQPRTLGILKTGYFRFDRLLTYVRPERAAQPELS